MYKLSYLKYQFFYNSSNLKKKYFKINRQLIIFNFLNKLKFYVYNGKKWMFIYVNIQKHIWKKFGEFYFTKKRSLYLSKRKLKKRSKRKKKKK